MKTSVRRRRWRGGVALVLATSVVLVLAAGAPPAGADSPQTSVLDWNKHALDALANAQGAAVPGAGMAAYVQGVHLGMVHGAVYDAVNSIVGGYEPYLDVPSASSGASESAAVATAARDTLIGVLNQAVSAGALPSAVRDTIVTRLQGLHAAALAAANDGDVAQGIAAGQAAAAAMLAARSNDGRWGPFRLTCGDDAGEWRPVGLTTCPTPPSTVGSDAFAWVAKVKPFVVESNTQFLSQGPPALDSGLYANEYDEVKALGAVGSTRTAEQQALVGFFQANPVEMFNRSYRAHALGEGLDVAEQARFFAKLSLANADTFITCWESKAHWSNWRPQTAIRLGDQDGNPKTAGDPAWTSAVGTPPYPDVASGYNCTTAAQMEIGESYFGQGRTSFSVLHPTLGTREYRHFRDVVDDTIDARVFMGIHFRTADEVGAKLGRDVARFVDKHALQRAK